VRCTEGILWRDAPRGPRGCVREITLDRTRRTSRSQSDRVVVVDSDARDRALLAAYRAGDRGALEALLEGHRARLYAVCVRMVNCPDAASDLTQETMVKILQGLDDFAGRSRLSTWMIRVAMNVCLTHRRRERLRDHLSIDLPACGEGGALASCEEGLSGVSIVRTRACGRELCPHECAEGRELRQRMYSCIGELAVSARSILILRDVCGMDYDRIAELLGIPKGTVKSRLFRARRSLRRRIESPGSRSDPLL